MRKYIAPAPSGELGDYIRNARLAHPEFKSLRHFAVVLGKSPSYVSKVERNDECPSPETLVAIARLLDIDCNELLKRANRIDPYVLRDLSIRAGEVSTLLDIIRLLDTEQVKLIEDSARHLLYDEEVSHDRT